MKRKIITVITAMLCCLSAGCTNNTDSSMIVVGESSSSEKSEERETAASEEKSDTKENTEEITPDTAQTEENSQTSAEVTTLSSSTIPADTTPPENTDPESAESYAVIGEETFEENSDDNSRYAQMTKDFGNDYLGLPSANKEYIFEYTGNSADIEGSLCREVACYDEHEGERYYMCSYYINHDGTAVYRYYESENRYALLPEKGGYGRLDPTVQTPEEIFEKAEKLYTAVKYALLPSSYDNCTIIDDIMYYMVCDEELDTKAKLLEALDGYFVRELSNTLLDASYLKEGENGKLYTIDYHSPVPDNYNGARYELSSLTEDTAVFTVYPLFEDENGESAGNEYNCTAVRINGLWRFESFRLPWEN